MADSARPALYPLAPLRLATGIITERYFLWGRQAPRGLVQQTVQIVDRFAITI